MYPENRSGILQNLLVADGMGGHNAGDYASKFVVQVLKKSLQRAERISRAMLKKQLHLQIIN